LIGYLRGQESIVMLLDRLIESATCTVTSVTVYELLFGAARVARDIGEDKMLAAIEALPFDASAARQAARLHARLIQQNQEIGVKDILIAAICIEHNVPFVTSNLRHFERIAELTVLSPEKALQWIEQP
jgi:tRNA(fMet)-specific endonuclease VapC